MKPKTHPPQTNPTPLRQRAEEALRQKPKPPEKLSRADMQTLIHELQVHQIELEMQNEELRRTQLELEIARDKYSNLYDFAPVGYLTLDDKNIIREANLTAAAMLGVERAHLVKTRFTACIAPQGQDAFYLCRKAVLDTQRRQTCEVRIVKPDGSEFDASLEAVVVRDADGAVTLRVSLSDITARKRAEEALRASEERYRDLVENSRDLIYTHDLQGWILSVNHIGAVLLGASPQALVGRNLMELLAPEEKPKFGVYLNQLQSKGSAEGTWALQGSSGMRCEMEYYATVRAGAAQGAYVRGMAHDVTQRNRAEPR